MKFLYSLTLHVSLGLFLFSGQTLSAQDVDPSGRNVTLFDHIEPISTQEAGGLHNSCWGYTAPDGREYAFLGTFVGTYVIDITDKPVRTVSFVPGPHSVWRNIKVYRNYAYVVNENRELSAGAGLQIIDLTPLPDSVHLLRTDTSHFLSAHTIWIADHSLFAMGTRSEAEANGGAYILDLEPDPVHPIRSGVVDPFYFHDAFVRNDTLVGAGIYGDGGAIYDIHDRTAPRLLGMIRYPYSGTHNTALTQDGKFALTTDEIGFTPKTLKVWDISDPDDIVMVAQYTPNVAEIIHNVRVRGRYGFAAWYTAGIRVVDLIDPRHPREVGYLDTYPGPDGDFNGVWEVYPFFPSGKVVASDRNSGLYVFTFNGSEAGSLSGKVRDGSTGQPLDNVGIRVESGKDTTRSGPGGDYYVGGIVGEEIVIRFSRYGYRDTVVRRTLGGDDTAEISLQPLPSFTYHLELVDAGTGRPLDDFVYGLFPVIPSTDVSGNELVISLPEGERVITLGRWGYQMKRIRLNVPDTGRAILVNMIPGYQDDATLDLGWSYRSDDDRATTGIWNRIRPYLGYPNSDWVHPETEPAGTDGPIFFTGQPPLFAPPETGDVNSGQTTLTSPLMDMSGYGDPIIAFDRWFIHYQRDSVIDSLVVELSNNNGRTWQLAHWETKQIAGWKRVVLFPREILPLTDSMRIRFRVSDRLGNILVEAGMDNFEVIDRVFSGVDPEAQFVPSTGNYLSVFLRTKGRISAVQVFDLLGRQVYAGNGIEAIETFIESETTSGGLFFMLITIDNKNAVYRIIK